MEAHHLAFSCEFAGKIHYFVFTVLVFGLATAPFVCTKVVHVPIKHWRSLAIHISAFIDDVFGGDSSFEEALNFSNIIRRDLLKSRFVAPPFKSEWSPRHEGQHLGFLVNLKQGLFSIPPKKVSSLKHKLELFHSSQKTTARKISSLVGAIVSMGIAIGPVARMWTRMCALVNKAPSWDFPITSDNTSAEIEFWSLCFEKCNGNHIWPISPIVNVMSYSDSSGLAWGGYMVQIVDHIAEGSFTEVETVQNSTWRELKDTFYVLVSYLKQLQGMVVKQWIDNQNVVRALSNGSKTELVQELVVDIFKLWIKFNIQLVPEWIRRGNNQ